MILPKETPYKDRLHSYYLIFENFVVAMQEEIGSGCIYCRSARQSHRVYFLPDALGRCVVENRGQPPRTYHQLGEVINAFKVLPFIVSVYFLNRAAVEFWGQLASRQIVKTPVAGVNPTSLEDMVERHKAEQFSGLFDITTANGGGGLLFFKDGVLVGGSYAWGRGGLSPSKSDYRRLIDLVADERCTLEIGRFTPPDV